MQLNDGIEGVILKNVPTTVTVTANKSRGGVDSYTRASFQVTYSASDVWIKMSFSNVTFAAPPRTNVSQMNVLYLKVETNISAAIEGSVVTLRYNQSSVLFTERALWIFSYQASGSWTRIDTTIDNDNDIVTFPMPLGTSLELCLSGEETRGMEFPYWAWILILLSFSIITFMAVGELVYQGYIPVAMKGTDGRVLVAFKRFFGAWGRKFTQLNDRVGGFIDYYENMSRTVPPIPPEKRPKAVSSLGHINRLGLQEEAEKLEEVYRPIESPIKPIIVAKTVDKNPLAKAVFQESTPAPIKQEEEPGEKTFTPYVPAAVRAKMGEKSQPKAVIKPAKEEKREKPALVIKPKPSPTATPPPSETKVEEVPMPPDLLQEATAAIKETPAVEGKPKPAKKAVKKKAAKKISKKAAKKPAAEV